MVVKNENGINFNANRKLTIVGIWESGKTSLLQAALQGRYPPKEQPFDQCPGLYTCTVLNEAGEDSQVELVLWDSGGGYEQCRLEVLKYAYVDVVVIVFAIDLPDQLEVIEESWLPQVEYSAPGVPIVLVGLRKDLRDKPDIDGSKKATFISKKLGERLAHRIRAFAFVECSSFTGEGISEVFEAAARAALNGPSRKINKKRKDRRWAKCVVS